MTYFTKEQTLLAQTISNFAKSELAAKASEIDEKETWNEQAFKAMATIGLLGITAPSQYGGSELGCVEATLAMEMLSEACASTALTYLAHTILCVNNLNENGSETQKACYLPKLISGEWIGGMGMTEPGAGSDALSLKTRAIRKGGKYYLSGTKMFITNGPIGDLFVVYARTGDSKKDISTFLVEKKSQGFRVGKKLHKFGMRGSPTSELIFENCEVPEENRIGRENDSVAHMMRNLNIERITISGISLGVAAACLSHSVRYAKERVQFGKPLAYQQMIQEKISEMYVNLEAGRALTYEAAKAYDNQDRLMTLGAKAKLFTAQMATKAALDAIQIFGGYGYMKEYPVERFMRDAKLMEIGAGTNEIMRLILAKHILNLDESM